MSSSEQEVETKDASDTSLIGWDQPNTTMLPNYSDSALKQHQVSHLHESHQLQSQINAHICYRLCHQHPFCFLMASFALLLTRWGWRGDQPLSCFLELYSGPIHKHSYSWELKEGPWATETFINPGKRCTDQPKCLLLSACSGSISMRFVSTPLLSNTLPFSLDLPSAV